MKKFLLLLVTIALNIFLCSCATNNSEEIYFIHAIGFDNHGEEITLSVVLEKTAINEQSSTDSGNGESSKTQSSVFETVSFTDKNIEKAFIQLKNKYKRTYFGTSEVYFLSTGLLEENLRDLCKFLPSQTMLPSKSIVVSVDSMSCYSFLKNTKDMSFLEQIKDIEKKEKVNIIYFLSQNSQGNKTLYLPCFSYDEKIKKLGNTKCKSFIFGVGN